jgi:PST family polysaccharide transporter
MKSTVISKPSVSENSGDAAGHFEMPLSNLKGRAVSSGFVTISAQGVQFVLNLVGVMLLARLLTPQDFGLVAMVTTIVSFLRIFNDAGLSTATIQREGITHAQVSNLFWTNVACGGLISVLLVVSAPAIAWFYREPRLVAITIALSTTFILTTAGVQHLALLKRRMRFRTIAMIQVSSVSVGVLVGVTMARMNFGYWSPVGMQVTMPFVTLLLTWWASDWRPQLPKRSSGTRSLLNFGANITASSFLWSLAKGSDGLFIGRFYGPAPLGLYTRAGALVSRPMEQFMSPIVAVVVPTLSRLQPQPERYRRVVLQIYEATAVASFLFTGLLFALSRPLTLVVLGPKWEETAPILAGLTFAALYEPVASVASWMLMSQGRGKDFLVQSVIGSCLTVVSCLVGLPFGPKGVAMSYSAFCIFVALPLVYYIAGKRGPVSSWDLWGRFFTHLPVWVVVCSTTWLTRRAAINLQPLQQLLFCGAVGLLAGVSFIFLYAPSRRAAMGVISSVAEWKRNRAA